MGRSSEVAESGRCYDRGPIGYHGDPKEQGGQCQRGSHLGQALQRQLLVVVDFPAAPGDQITIVLVGTGGTGGPDPSCNTTPIPEQEPNDDPAQQSQDIGTLQSGGCITVAGSTDTGFGNPDAPDPNADRDHYLFSLVGVSRLRIDFDIAVGQTFIFGVFDADTGAPLEDQGPPDAIEVAVPVQTNRIVFRILTDVPSSYTLTFSDRSGTGTPPLGALTSGPRKIEQRP